MVVVVVVEGGGKVAGDEDRILSRTATLSATRHISRPSNYYFFVPSTWRKKKKKVYYEVPSPSIRATLS